MEVFNGTAGTVNDRIVLLMQHEGLSPAAFARKIGIGDQTVRSVCVMKRNKPGYDFLNNIVQTFEWLNPTWLLTGKGDMTMSPNPSNPQTAESSETKNFKDLINYLKEKDNRIETLIQENTTLKVIYANCCGDSRTLNLRNGAL